MRHKVHEKKKNELELTNYSAGKTALFWGGGVLLFLPFSASLHMTLNIIYFY